MLQYNVTIDCQPTCLLEQAKLCPRLVLSDNVKALFRRAKAHVGAWNPQEAKKDFLRVVQIDKTLDKAVQKELKILANMENEKDAEDKEKLKGKLFT